MKVMTILGTRPELIRLSIIIKKLDEACDHVIVHTGQNYDYNLDGVFRDELGIREPDHYLGAKGSFGEQAGIIFDKLEKIIAREKPDVFLVLGDTNSSLGAVVAKRMGVRVFHMEAGNRCYDDRVPEEVNRRIIDHSSDILMPYTERSRQNLLAEGIEGRRIYVTGNPITEVMINYHEDIGNSAVLDTLDLDASRFILVTLHRAENVDNLGRLDRFVEAINKLPDRYEMPVMWSVHPRTRQKLDHNIRSEVRLLEPLGLFDFVRLEKNAYCVLTDSGTVQEECSIFTVPVVTLRDSTERPETLEVGSNFISGCEPDAIMRGIDVATNNRGVRSPGEYQVENVSDTVVKIVLGFYV